MASSSPPRSTCTSSPDQHRDSYPVDLEPRFILDLDRHMAGSSTRTFFDAPAFQRPPPAHYIGGGGGERMEMECSNVPLNLSVSSSKTKSSSVADEPSAAGSPSQLHSQHFLSSPRDRWNESVTREDHEHTASSSPRNHRNQSSSPATNHSASSFPVNISNSLRFTGNRNSPSSSMLSGYYAHQSANKHCPWTHEQTSVNKHSPWTHEQTSVNKHSPWTHEQTSINKHSPRTYEQFSLNKYGPWTHEQSSLVHGSSWASPKISSTKWPESDRLLYHEKSPAQDSLSCGSFPRPQETCNPWSTVVKPETSSQNGAALGTHHNLPPMVRQNMRTFTAWRSVDVGERSPNQSVDRGSEVMSDSPPLNHGCYAVGGDVRQSHLKESRQESEPRISAASGTGGECEEGIEEHFQRSLGKDYPKCMSKTEANHHPPSPMTTSAPAAVEKRNASSVTGAVDDHFAKSLGATWTKIKCLTDSPPTVQTSGQPVHGPSRALSRQLDPRHDSPSRRIDLAWPASGRNQDLSRRIESDGCTDTTRHLPRERVEVSSALSGSPHHHDLARHLEHNARHDSPKRQSTVFQLESSSRREADSWQESRAPIDSSVGWEAGGIRPDSDNYQRTSMSHDVRLDQDVRQHQDRCVPRDTDQLYNPIKHQEYDNQKDSPTINRELGSHVRQEVNMQQYPPQHSDAIHSSRWNKGSDTLVSSEATISNLKQDMKLNEQSRVWDDSLRLQSEAGLNHAHLKQDKVTQNDVEELSNWRRGAVTSNPRRAWELSQDRTMRPSSGGKLGSGVRPGSAGSQDGRSWHELGALKGSVNPLRVEMKRNNENTQRTLPAEDNISPTLVLQSNRFVRQHSLTLRNENHEMEMDTGEEHQKVAFIASDNKKDSDVNAHTSKSLQHSSVVPSYPSSQEDRKCKSYLEMNTEIIPDLIRSQKSINNLDLSSAVAVTPVAQCDSTPIHDEVSVSPDSSIRSVPALVRDTVVLSDAVLRPNTTSITQHNSAVQSGVEEGDNVVRTDSVDDHFAKALGDTWLRLKEAKNEKSSISNQCWP